MNIFRLVGMALFVMGVVLVVIGLNASDAPADQLSNAITGQYTDRTMWYLVVGIAAAVTGGLLAAFGARLKT
jgi:hypothetical protein